MTTTRKVIVNQNARSIGEINGLRVEMGILRDKLNAVAELSATHSDAQRRLAKGDLKRAEKILVDLNLENKINPDKELAADIEEIKEEIEFLSNKDHYNEQSRLHAKRTELQQTLALLSAKERKLMNSLVVVPELSKEHLIKAFAQHTFALQKGGHLVENWVQLSLMEFIFGSNDSAWRGILSREWDKIQSDIENQLKEAV